VSHLTPRPLSCIHILSLSFSHLASARFTSAMLVVGTKVFTSTAQKEFVHDSTVGALDSWRGGVSVLKDEPMERNPHSHWPPFQATVRVQIEVELPVTETRRTKTEESGNSRRI